MQLYLVRHGQTIANLHYDDYAWDNNEALTPLGVREASAAAAWLRAEKMELDVVCASPLLRAQQTAEIIAKEFGIAAQEDDGLIEANVGEWRTRIGAAVYAQFMELPPARRFTFCPPAGETWAQAGQRVARVAERFARQGAARVVLVSHAVPIQCAIGVLTGAPYAAWPQWSIDNASLTCLTFAGGTWQLNFADKIVYGVNRGNVR